MRFDDRDPLDLRPVKIMTNVNRYAEGSVLIECGNTRVLCLASVEESVPKWLQGLGRGWVTAEYGMIPRSTHTRMRREQVMSSGRTQEISRLIARSLRSAIDLHKLGERQITIDCDVLQADGGTRTTAITGGFVALALCLETLIKRGELSVNPLKQYVSAISIGLQDNSTLVDLCYEEDSRIGTDMNFVMTSDGRFVEIQGTAETQTFSEDDLQKMVAAAKVSCQKLFAMQSQAIGRLLPL